MESNFKSNQIGNNLEFTRVTIAEKREKITISRYHKICTEVAKEKKTNDQSRGKIETKLEKRNGKENSGRGSRCSDGSSKTRLVRQIMRWWGGWRMRTDVTPPLSCVDVRSQRGLFSMRINFSV